MDFRQALAAFAKDLQNPKVGWIKLVFFFLNGAAGCLYPLLPLYMKSLGLQLNEVALIRSLGPVATLLGIYLATRLASTTPKVRVLLTVLTALTAVFPLLLLTVPTGRQLLPLPQHTVLLTLFCGITSHEEIFLLPVPPVPRFSCHLPEDTGTLPSLIVGTCGHMCAYDFEVVRSGAGESVSAREAPVPGAIKLGTRFFVPETEVDIQHCSLKRSSQEAIRRCKLERLLQDGRDYANVTIHVARHPHLTDRTLITLLSGAESAKPALWHRCRSTIGLHCDVNGTSRLHHCQHQCIASVTSHHLCINHTMMEAVSVRAAFWLLLVLLFGAELLGSLALTLLDAAVSDHLRDSAAQLDRQKQFGLLGRLLLPTAVGFLVDRFSTVGHINFTCLLLAYSSLQLVVAGCLWLSSLQALKPPKIRLKKVLNTLRNIELDTLLFTALAGGVFCGFLEHFLLWHLEDLGASVWLLELSVGVAAAASLPVLVFAEPILDRLGCGNLVAAGLFAVGCQLIGYSLLTAPELCLLLELLEPLVKPLFLRAVLRYSKNISKDNADTAGRLASTAYYGLGRGVGGALIGALLYLLHMDFPASAQAVGGCALASAAIYTLFWYCCFKYVRQAVPEPPDRPQRSRWGSVRYLSFRRSRIRRAMSTPHPQPPSPTKPNLDSMQPGPQACSPPEPKYNPS